MAHSHALPQTLSGFYTSEKGVIMTKSGRLLKNGKKNLEKRSRRWSNSSTSCPVNSLSTPIRALVFKGHGGGGVGLKFSCNITIENA